MENRAVRRQKSLDKIRKDAANLLTDGNTLGRLVRRQFSKNIKRLARRSK